MRLILTTIILTMLAQPTAAIGVDCPDIRNRADNLAESAKSGESKMKAMRDGYGAYTEWADWQKDQLEETYEIAMKNWQTVEMYANIYSAFCK